MALIKLTAFLDNVSGKLNGTVFARNKGGAYVRSKSNPTNPQTAKQSAVRSIFSGIQQSWRGLTDEQRAAWDSSTDDYPYQNRLGDQKNYSGSQLYSKLNLNLASVGLPQINTPSLPVALELPTSISATVEPGSSTFEVSGLFVGTPGTDTLFAVFATESSSAGRKNLKTRLRKIGVVNASVLSGGPNLWSQYIAVFGLPVVGSNIGIQLRPVQGTTGQGGAPFYIVTEVV